MKGRLLALQAADDRIGDVRGRARDRRRVRQTRHRRTRCRVDQCAGHCGHAAGRDRFDGRQFGNVVAIPAAADDQ